MLGLPIDDIGNRLARLLPGLGVQNLGKERAEIGEMSRKTRDIPW